MNSKVKKFLIIVNITIAFITMSVTGVASITMPNATFLSFLSAWITAEVFGIIFVHGLILIIIAFLWLFNNSDEESYLETLKGILEKDD